jgi:NTE family protein
VAAVGHGFRVARGLPREERRGVALCLSGGGYRASLFHLGAMTRLDELGILSRVDTFASVSGGSIALAQLAAHRRTLGDGWPAPGERVPEFQAGVVEPMRAFAQQDVRSRPVLRSWHPKRWLDQNAGIDALAEHYTTGPARGRSDDFPDRPRFVFCATDLRFRTQWTVDTGRRVVGSDAAGYAPLDDSWPLARAVAASSCFPPVFRPMLLDNDPRSFAPGAYDADDRDELVRELELTDGGIYDNLGVEPVWNDHRHVLVSDAAPSLTPAPRLSRLVWKQLRLIATLLEQATDVRKRWLIANYVGGELGGAYWGIASLPSNYPKPERPVAPGVDEEQIQRLVSQVRIDLDVFSDGEIAVLECHGYAMADLAVAAHARELESPDAAPPRPPHGERAVERAYVERELKESDQTKLFRRGVLSVFKPRISRA